MDGAALAALHRWRAFVPKHTSPNRRANSGFAVRPDQKAKKPLDCAKAGEVVGKAFAHFLESNLSILT